MMYNIDELSLMTGADIYVPEFSAKIYQPSMEEIAIIGEGRFFQSLSLFFINEDQVKDELLNSLELSKEDADALDSYSILLLFLNGNKDLRQRFIDIINLTLVDYLVMVKDSQIIFYNEQAKNEIIFTKENYSILKDILYQIFKFEKLLGQSDLRAKGKRAKEIAEKMRKAREKVKKLSSEKESKSIFSRYISILSIGSNALNIKDVCELTLYQLYDQFERFNLYTQNCQMTQAALAGSKVDPIDWFKELQ